MTGFTGNYLVSLDPKFRAAIPVGYREKLGETFCLAPNVDFSAICIYPNDTWDAMYERILSLPKADPEVLKFKRLIMGNAYPNTGVDIQGRVMIPQSLREYVKDCKNVRFLGMGDCIEIFADTAYDNTVPSTTEEKLNSTQYISEKYGL